MVSSPPFSCCKWFPWLLVQRKISLTQPMGPWKLWPLSSSLALSHTLSLSRLQLMEIFVFVFCFFRATPAAYGGSQARSQIGAAAAGIHRSHSNARRKPDLQPIPQLMAVPDPQFTERGQGIELVSSWILVRFISAEPGWELSSSFSPKCTHTHL